MAGVFRMIKPNHGMVDETNIRLKEDGKFEYTTGNGVYLVRITSGPIDGKWYYQQHHHDKGRHHGHTEMAAFIEGKKITIPEMGFNVRMYEVLVTVEDGRLTLAGALSMGEYDRIYNVFNQKVIKILDEYYQMDKGMDEDYKITLTGLDTEKGKPAFYTGENTSFLNTPYRLTIGDIEKCSIIVPDISLIQKGDILVNVKYNIGGDPHVGIVVGLLTEPPQAYGTDARDFWNNVIVLSVRRGLRMVTIGRWGNPEGIFGGFTTNPEDFQIRRLLSKTNDNPPEKRVEDDKWELIDPVMSHMTCDITLKIDPYTNQPNHWIPNTYEMLEIDSIKITGYDLEGSEFNFPLNPLYNNIKLLAPEDMYYNFTEAEGKSNIYTNKGPGLEFYALTDGVEPILLAHFTPGTIDEYTTGETYFTVQGVAPYLKQNGEAAEGYKLYVDDFGYLSFGVIKENGELEEHKRFGVKAKNAVRPGDDFLLRFGLAGDICAPAVADDGDFMACYDKKLLWRANAYIDESMTEDGRYTGIIDWNDLNPWPGNSQSLNDWRTDNLKIPSKLSEVRYNSMLDAIADGNDKSYINNFYTTSIENTVTYYNPNTSKPGYNENTIRNLLQKYGIVHRIGGQIEIKPWTRPYDTTVTNSAGEKIFSNSQTTVYNAIPYSIGGFDSPGEVNEELLQQMEAIKKWSDGNSTWNKTTAPDDLWVNYIDYEFSTGVGLNGTVNIGPPYPYQPVRRSVGQWTSATNKYNGKDYALNNQKQASGIDCMGFIKRSTQYAGNNYDIGLNMEFWLEWKSDDDSAKLYWWDAETNLKDDAVTLLNWWDDPDYKINNPTTSVDKSVENLYIPGDIIVVPGTISHFMMIAGVAYKTNGRIIDPNRVLIIESDARYTGNWRVLKDKKVW